MLFTNQNAKIVACILLFRKSRDKPNLKSTSKYGFTPIFFFFWGGGGGGEGKWRCSEHAHASYPGLSFRPLGFSSSMRREERRAQGLHY